MIRPRASRIGDDEPVAEPIEQAALGLDDETRREDLLVRVALLPQIGQQPVGKVGRVCDTELLDRLLVDPPPGDVLRRGLALGRAAEGLAEVEVRGLMRGEEPLLALALSGWAAAGELDAGLFGEHLQGLGLVEAVDLDQPVEDITPFSTSETMERPPIRIDAERWRLLGVERAEAAVRAPGLAQVHALAHELDDVHALLDEVEITGHDS